MSLSARALERLRGVVPRETVDDALDWLRAKIDSPRSLAYQPLAAAADHGGGVRAGGTESRWRAIEPVVRELDASTAVDVGCNLGWFSVQLGLAGIPTVGVEGHPPAYRTAIYSARKAGAPNVAILAMHVTTANVSLGPTLTRRCSSRCGITSVRARDLQPPILCSGRSGSRPGRCSSSRLGRRARCRALPAAPDGAGPEDVGHPPPRRDLRGGHRPASRFARVVADLGP